MYQVYNEKREEYLNYCETTGKRCLSRKEANEIISHYKTNHRGRYFSWSHRGKNVPQRSYYCEYCGTFHLTHFKKKSQY